MNPGWYVWLGILTTLWVVTILAAVYAGWRYVYAPWLVMRRDIAALAMSQKELQAHVDQTLASRRMEALDDEEIAHREQALRYRQSIRRGQRNVPASEAS